MDKVTLKEAFKSMEEVDDAVYNYFDELNKEVEANKEISRDNRKKLQEKLQEKKSKSLKENKVKKSLKESCNEDNECNECGDKPLKEVFSKNIPQWFLDYVKENKYFARNISNAGLDLNNITVYEDDKPTSPKDKRFDDPNIKLIFEVEDDDGDKYLYIPGVNDDRRVTLNWRNTSLGRLGKQTLINNSDHFGYIDMTDISTSNRDKRDVRMKNNNDRMKRIDKGLERDRKEAQHKQYDQRWIDGSYDDTGRYIPGRFVNKDTYRWVDRTGGGRWGYDKSGYKLHANIEEIKKKLYEGNLSNYGETLDKMEKVIENYAKEVSNLQKMLKAPKLRKGKGTARSRYYGYSDKYSYIDRAMRQLKTIYECFSGIIDRVDGIVNHKASEYNGKNIYDDEWKDKELRDFFRGEKGYFSSVKDFREYCSELRKTIAYAKEKLSAKEESLTTTDNNTTPLKEATQIDITDEEDVEKGKEILKDNQEETGTEGVEQIVDVDAETVDQLKDSYVGNVILQCPVCRTLIYKKPDLLNKDEENLAENPKEQLYNLGEQCPHCGSEDGYYLVGQVASMNVDAEDDVEETTGKDEPFEDDNIDNDIDRDIDKDIEDDTFEDENNDELGADKPQEEEEDEEVTFESLDIDRFNNIANTYLTEVYSNVDSFTTTNATVDDTNNKLVIEGVIKYKSGKSKNTKFEFLGESITEDNKYVFKGLNETFAKGNDKAFTLKASIDNNTLISESLDYAYTVENKKLNESKIVKGSTLKEARVAGRGQKLDKYFKLTSKYDNPYNQVDEKVLEQIKKAIEEVKAFEPTSDYEVKDKQNCLDQLERIVADSKFNDK